MYNYQLNTKHIWETFTDNNPIETTPIAIHWSVYLSYWLWSHEWKEQHMQVEFCERCTDASIAYEIVFWWQGDRVMVQNVFPNQFWIWDLRKLKMIEQFWRVVYS